MRQTHRRTWLFQSLRAAFCLAMARVLVRVVPLKFWRATLGQIVPGDIWSSDRSGNAGPSLPHPRAAFLAGRVESASYFSPGTVKCLPRAAALQWMLRGDGIAADLVIAFDIHDRLGDDAYHAWVEIDGEFLIGHCDRSVYRPIMVFRCGGSGQ